MSKIPAFKFALREDLTEEKKFLPTRAEPKATGWDVRAAFPDRKSVIILPFQKLAIPLGIRGFCPDGWWYEIKPRSSTYTKRHLNALYGTIDETYEGELIFACQYIPELVLTSSRIGVGEFALRYTDSMQQVIQIDFGDAIGQIIPRRRQEMDVIEISNEEYKFDCENRSAVRREGGFGSTGG